MSTLLASYTLKSPGQKYTKIDNLLSSYGTHWRFLETTWLVVSPESPAQLRDRLWALMDGNDEVFVVDVSRDPAAWNGFGAAGDKWLLSVLQ